MAGPCGDAVNLEAIGGISPHYRLPFAATVIPKCSPGMTTLLPGATVTLHELVPLTSSGQVTLEVQGDVLQTSEGPNGEQSGNWIPSPLEGHWPSLIISVVPTSPRRSPHLVAGRGNSSGSSAPPAARSHLYYTYTAACLAARWGKDSEPSASGNLLPPPRYIEPESDQQTGPNLRWSYAVSSPGFSIVGGANRIQIAEWRTVGEVDLACREHTSREHTRLR